MPNKGMPYTGERPKPIGCPIKDDVVAKELPPKMREADGYIYGSPVYGLSYCSQFRLATERLTPGIWEGAFSYKPACSVTVGEMALAGQETCLADMNRMICGSEAICVSWYLGVHGVSGPPYGPYPADKDYGANIGVKKHRYSQWLAVMNGRRVAEMAVVQKLAKKQLGSLWDREFLHVCHPPHGEEPWSWRRLDKEDEEYMQSLRKCFSTKGRSQKSTAANLKKESD